MPEARRTLITPRTLVIGAAGQVGAQLVHQLGPDRALAAGRTPQPPAHLAGYSWLQLDLEQLARNPAQAPALLAAAQPCDAVLCVAGATDVERCESEPAWAAAVNTDGPAVLAAALPREIPFAFFSTEYVFDGGARGPESAGPYTEQRPTHALSVYGRSKLRGEQAVLRARPDALILRTTVVYGPDPARKNFLYFLHRELSAGKPIRVVTDQISTPTSNDDLASATLRLLKENQTGIFHVCGPDLLSRYDFAVRAARALALDPTLIQPITTASLHQRAPRPLAAGLLTAKLRALVGPSLMKNTEAGALAWKQSLAQPTLPQK